MALFELHCRLKSFDMSPPNTTVLTASLTQVGLRCYVVATELGKSLYQHYGFTRMDKADLEEAQPRLEHFDRLTPMVRQPIVSKSIAKPKLSIFEREITPGIYSRLLLQYALFILIWG